MESNICEYAGKVESHPGRWVSSHNSLGKSTVERQLFSLVGPARFCATLAMTGIRFVDIAPWPRSVLLYVPFTASVQKSK